MTSARHKNWNFTKSSVECITNRAISDIRRKNNSSTSEALQFVIENLVSVLVEKKIIKTEEFQKIFETEDYILCDDEEI
jgi:hypothetical protein